MAGTPPSIGAGTRTVMDKPIRVGAVHYLNTKPLICDLDLLAPDAELILDVPSRLADLLAAGELDVALIPVIEYLPGRRLFRRSRRRHRYARPGAERDAVQPQAVGRGPPRRPGRRLAHQRRPYADSAPQTVRRSSRDRAAAAGPRRRGRGRRRGPAHRRPRHAGLPARLRPRLRPRPRVVRLDRPAVRLRRLGRAAGRRSLRSG